MLIHLAFLLVILVASSPCSGYGYSSAATYYMVDKFKARCNCGDHKQCIDGQCEASVGCATGFVGTNCQHLSVEWVVRRVSVFDYELHDHDISTCRSWDSSAWFDGTVEYSLTQVVQFVWVYLHFYRPRKNYDFHPAITLYEDDEQVQADIYVRKISDNSILLKSRNDVVYDEIEISGLPGDICSIDISIGRNVAYANVRTTSSAVKSMLYDSSFAVDGAESIRYQYPPRCFHSGENKQLPVWWKVSFKFNARLSLVKLLNSQDKRALFHFTLETYASSHSLIQRYVDKSSDPKEEYTVAVGSKSLVKALKILMSKTGKLGLCEVSVYGEYKCDSGYHGMFCHLYCPGCRDDACDPDWGTIKGVCNHRWRGDDCQIDCRFKWGLPNCNKDCEPTCGSTESPDGRGDCDLNTGDCLYGCILGYNRTASARCTQKCKFPYYGKNCEEMCFHCNYSNSYGTRRCNYDSGRCVDGCDPDYTGNLCDCPYRYGPKCAYACPEACAGIGDCVTSTGECRSGCKPGFIPPNCNATCNEGEHGINCSKTCNTCARNKTTKAYACDPVSGECLLGCDEGFGGGSQCEEIEVNDNVVVEAARYNVLGFIILFVVLLYKSLSTGVEDSTEADPEQGVIQATLAKELGESAVDEDAEATSPETEPNHNPLSMLTDMFRASESEPKEQVDQVDEVDQVQNKGIWANIFGTQKSSPGPESKEEVEQQQPEKGIWTTIFGAQQSSADTEKKDEIGQLSSTEPNPKTDQLSNKPFPEKVIVDRQSSMEPKAKEEVSQLSTKSVPDKTVGAQRSFSKPTPKEEVRQLSTKPVPDKTVGAQRSFSKPKSKEVAPLLNESKWEEVLGSDMSSSVDEGIIPSSSSYSYSSTSTSSAPSRTRRSSR